MVLAGFPTNSPKLLLFGPGQMSSPGFPGQSEVLKAGIYKETVSRDVNLIMRQSFADPPLPFPSSGNVLNEYYKLSILD
jgi:hypothetical protein